MTEVIERDATRAPVKSDTPPEPKAPRLLDQVRERIRVLHYSRLWPMDHLRGARRRPQSRGAFL